MQLYIYFFSYVHNSASISYSKVQAKNRVFDVVSIAHSITSFDQSMFIVPIYDE